MANPEHLALVRDREAPLPGWREPLDLQNADLTDLDLSGADLSGADLTGARR